MRQRSWKFLNYRENWRQVVGRRVLAWDLSRQEKDRMLENQNLNLTETCFNCKKSAARWQLAVGNQQTKAGFLTQTSDYAILFCPVCDAFTPEDLAVTDDRTLTLPTPKTLPSDGIYHLTFHGAEAYRIAMGPNRPFREKGKKTMCRRYDHNGEEIVN